jgi:hypothetical protein
MRQQAAAHQVRPQKLQPLRRWCGTGGHVGGTPAEPDSATKMPCITAGRHGKSGLVGALAAAGKTEGSRTSKAAANAHRLKKAGRQTRRRGGGGGNAGVQASAATRPLPPPGASFIGTAQRYSPTRVPALAAAGGGTNKRQPWHRIEKTGNVLPPAGCQCCCCWLRACVDETRAATDAHNSGCTQTHTQLKK